MDFVTFLLVKINHAGSKQCRCLYVNAFVVAYNIYNSLFTLMSNQCFLIEYIINWLRKRKLEISWVNI